MDYKGLEKTFGVKIPVYKHADYYIETLKKSLKYTGLDKNIETFKKFEKNLVLEGKSVKEYKAKSIQNIVAELKLTGYVDALRDWKIEDNGFSKLGYVPKENGLYLSVDINEANWTVSKHFLGYDLPKWEEYLSGLGYPKALSESKSFRQYVLGNTIPKRFTAMQKSITISHLEMLPKKYRDMVVMISEDEIIFELNVVEESNKIMLLDWILPVKAKTFKTNYHNNYNDYIRVDSVCDNTGYIQYRELKAVNGNRFFLHFKSLILKEELDERDLLFMNDKHIAKWMI